MSKKSITRVPDAHPEFGSTAVFDTFKYSAGVKAGGLLFVAGQVGLRPDGSVPETAAEQADWAFRRLGVVLESEGLGFGDLVEIVSYHVNIDSQLADFREVKDRYIKADYPAWTILGVAALARASLLVEIRAVAALKT
jgi:enamine deaminase RidA (YjgF/YER057c/UK114 family)